MSKKIISAVFASILASCGGAATITTDFNTPFYHSESITPERSIKVTPKEKKVILNPTQTACLDGDEAYTTCGDICEGLASIVCNEGIWQQRDCKPVSKIADIWNTDTNRNGIASLQLPQNSFLYFKYDKFLFSDMNPYHAFVLKELTISTNQISEIYCGQKCIEPRISEGNLLIETSREYNSSRERSFSLIDLITGVITEIGLLESPDISGNTYVFIKRAQNQNPIIKIRNIESTVPGIDIIVPGNNVTPPVINNGTILFAYTADNTGVRDRLNNEYFPSTDGSRMVLWNVVNYNINTRKGTIIGTINSLNGGPSSSPQLELIINNYLIAATSNTTDSTNLLTYNPANGFTVKFNKIRDDHNNGTFKIYRNGSTDKGIAFELYNYPNVMRRIYYHDFSSRITVDISALAELNGIQSYSPQIVRQNGRDELYFRTVKEVFSCKIKQ